MSRYRKYTSNDPAASTVSRKACASPGLVEFPITATRDILGEISFISSSCLPPTSGARLANPVMFPPGRAKLTMKPLPTGSVSDAMTIGIVDVASLTDTGYCRTRRDDNVYF